MGERRGKERKRERGREEQNKKANAVRPKAGMCPLALVIRKAITSGGVHWGGKSMSGRSE